MSHPPPFQEKKELNIKHQTQMMEDSFHHMFFLFLKKSIYAGATQNITFLIICCTHWYIKHVIKNNMHLKHSNNNNLTSNIQCLIKHTMLLESRSKPGNQIIKADKKRINMLKENTVPLIYIFEMSRDIWFQIGSKTIWFHLIDLTKL